MLVNAQQLALCSLASADSCDVNATTVVNFKPPACGQWKWGSKEIGKTGSCKPARVSRNVQVVQVKWVSCSVVSHSLQPHGLHSPWSFPGQNTGVGNHSLFQGIFPTQGSNSGLPHCRWILYQLSQWGSPRILEWVAYPFSRGFSQPRSGTGVSCIAGGFFTNWAMREAWISLLY